MIIQNFFIVFISIITILLGGIFVFQFYKSPLSKNIADWGSFGDYIGGITLSLISILLLYKTYKEQIYANVIIRFESRFWNLKNRIGITKEELDAVSSIAKKITKHFIRENSKRKVTNGEFVALLRYYWILYTCSEEALCSQYFGKIQNLISMVVNSSVVRRQDKEGNLSTLFMDMTDNEILCLLSYLSFCSYRKCSYSLFSYDAIFSLIIKCDSLCGNVCKNNNDKVTCLELDIEDDFGYNDSDRKEESYIQTLDRIILNKNRYYGKNLD